MSLFDRESTPGLAFSGVFLAATFLISRAMLDEKERAKRAIGSGGFFFSAHTQHGDIVLCIATASFLSISPNEVSSPNITSILHFSRNFLLPLLCQTTLVHQTHSCLCSIHMLWPYYSFSRSAFEMSLCRSLLHHVECVNRYSIDSLLKFK